MIRTPPRKTGRSLSTKGRGFTLVELMITLLILSFVMLVALPGFATLSLSTRLKAYANDVVGSVYLARGEAIKRNAAITMCISTDGSTCAGSGNWAQGWIIRADDGTVISQQQSMTEGYKVTTRPGNALHTLTFEASGAASTSTAMTICRKNPEPGAQERVVTISATGKSSVRTTRKGSCN